MGLDMYLSAEKYISGYDHNKDENFVKILSLLNIDESDAENSINVNVTVGYWRKANAIHNWFVDNVQDCVDDCSTHYVSREKLNELKKDCQEALDKYNSGEKEAAAEILPPAEGFFFGSTEVDDWYKRDLENTIRIIEKCLNPKFDGFDFHYRASW